MSREGRGEGARIAYVALEDAELTVPGEQGAGPLRVPDHGRHRAAAVEQLPYDMAPVQSGGTGDEHPLQRRTGHVHCTTSSRIVVVTAPSCRTSITTGTASVRRSSWRRNPCTVARSSVTWSSSA